MRLVTFTESNKTRIGILKDARIIDLSAVAPSLPTDMVAFLKAGDAAMGKAKDLAATETGGFAVADVTLESPVRHPPKILAVGMNLNCEAGSL